MGQIVRAGNRLSVGILAATVWFSCVAAANAAETRGGEAGVEAGIAQRILKSTGVEGGLVVHLGCGQGRLTAALGPVSRRHGPRFVVHGLDTDRAQVAAARQHLLALGVYGRVSVGHFDGAALPYADNLVNLVVAEELGKSSRSKVEIGEVLRVLVPGGVACIGRDGQWTKTVKPWPADIGEWSHFLHDASNNAVAKDTRVGPPRRLQWTAGPLWTRSHEFTSSICAMVSANGRVFYILDEGLTGVTSKSLPERWTLIARDAFNGVLLWKRPMEKWGSRGWGGGSALRSVPPTAPRRIVADADRLFVTLGYGAGVSVLDAATGEVLQTCQGTEGTEEIRCAEGVLILRQGKNAVVAVDAHTAKKRWEATGKIQPLSLAVQDGKVFYQDGQTLVCRGLDDGKPLWKAPAESAVSLLVVHEDHILLLSGPRLQAVSVDTGETIWTVSGRVSRRELFVANDRLWHWEGDRVVGRDLNTGNVAERLDTEDVFTPGHHPRCYQSKATQRFIISPNRGAEFLSVCGGDHTQNDWVRGPCRYGVMPCNGLLYAPPNPCFCYPGVKLTGFNALAPAGNMEDEGRRTAEVGPPAARLHRGPAYGSPPLPLDTSSDVPRVADDWPTYRHDPRRSGATAGEVPPQVATQWKVRLSPRLTPPVVSRGRVYVAAKDQHTLYALDTEDGHRLWRFTAGGRIDSPPTVHGELVLFGCADGCVYCLRAADGELAWRFTAAPEKRLIMAFGQLESAWRVHGSILVDRGVAYGTAGRSTYLDGGIRVFGLDPKTGRVIHETRLDTWARTRTDAQNKPFIPGYHMEGAFSDILVSEGDHIFLGQYKLDRTLAQRETPYVMPGPDDKTVAMDLSKEPYVAADAEPKSDYETHQRKWLERTQTQLLADLERAHGGHNLGDRRMGLHVISMGGFLDDSWFNRTYWTYSATWPGFYLAHRAPKTGQLLVVGRQKTYAVQAFPSRNLQSPLFTPETTGYLLLADRNDNRPMLDHRTRGTTKGWGFMRTEPPAWHDWIPVRIRGMVLAGEHLFVAGPPDVVDPKDPMAAFEGRKGGVLLALSASDGKQLARCKLDSPPVFDGLIAAGGRLYLASRDGTLQCMGR